MIIRDVQIAVLSQGMERNFQRELAEEMRTFAPWHAQQIGDSGLMRCVQSAMSRAAQHGFTNRGPVRLYLQATFLLGADFDSDPLLPWAADALAATGGGDQNDRAGALFKKLTVYLEKVVGPDKAYAKCAAVKAAAALISAERKDSDAILDRLKQIYPEKCSYAGDAALQALIRAATSAAANYFGAARNGVATLCLLMFAMGHGFDADPHLPWIQEVLQTPELTPAALIERLSARVGPFWEHTLGSVL